MFDKKRIHSEFRDWSCFHFGCELFLHESTFSVTSINSTVKYSHVKSFISAFVAELLCGSLRRKSNHVRKRIFCKAMLDILFSWNDLKLRTQGQRKTCQVSLSSVLSLPTDKTDRFTRVTRKSARLQLVIYGKRIVN